MWVSREKWEAMEQRVEKLECNGLVTHITEKFGTAAAPAVATVETTDTKRRVLASPFGMATYIDEPVRIPVTDAVNAIAKHLGIVFRAGKETPAQPAIATVEKIKKAK